MGAAAILLFHLFLLAHVNYGWLVPSPPKQAIKEIARRREWFNRRGHCCGTLLRSTAAVSEKDDGGTDVRSSTQQQQQQRWRRLQWALELSQPKATLEETQTAVRLWRSILLSFESNTTTANASAASTAENAWRGPAWALFAAACVRLGQDDQAVSIYSRGLAELRSEGSTPTQTTITTALWMGRARAHQRLGQYRAAELDYRQVLSLSQDSDVDDNKSLAILWKGLVTCCARQGQYRAALEYLEEQGKPEAIEPSDAEERNLVHSILSFVVGRDIDETDDSDIIDDDSSGEQTDRQYRRLKQRMKLPSHATASLLELINFHVGPWDDPNLIRLDDKIHLHHLLTHDEGIDDNDAESDAMSSCPSTSITASFYPVSFVLPVTIDDPKDAKELLDQGCRNQTASTTWIAKRRNGYGSHGHTLITNASQLVQLVNGVSDCEEQLNQPKWLIQTLVHPPKLIFQRRFSLRVYVVYFLLGPIYLLPEGLVKLAEASVANRYDDEDNKEAAATLWTNSGRQPDSPSITDPQQLEQQQQYSFTWLKKHMAANGDDYLVLWSRIRQASRETLRRYQNHFPGHCPEATRNELKRLAQLRIPNILGLDFIVDNTEQEQPWLLEVNRFPGLEARNAQQDGCVKEQVLRTAWALAEELSTSTLAMAKANNTTRSTGGGQPCEIKETVYGSAELLL